MPRSVDSISKAISAAREGLLRLRRAVDQARRVLEIAAAGRFYEASDHLRRRPGTFSEILSISGHLEREALLAKAEADIAALLREAKLGYTESLEAALRQAGIQFAGSFPTYALEGVVQLKVDLARESVVIDRTRLATLDPQKVIAKSKGILDDLLRRPFSANAFGQLLLEAYNRCLSQQRGQPGDFVALRGVLDTVRERIGPGYDARKFGVDLMRLLVSETDLARRVELAPARSPTKAVLVPGPRPGYVSSIRFPQDDGTLTLSG